MHEFYNLCAAIFSRDVARGNGYSRGDGTAVNTIHDERKYEDFLETDRVTRSKFDPFHTVCRTSVCDARRPGVARQAVVMVLCDSGRSPRRQPPGGSERGSARYNLMVEVGRGTSKLDSMYYRNISIEYNKVQ